MIRLCICGACESYAPIFPKRLEDKGPIFLMVIFPREGSRSLRKKHSWVVQDLYLKRAERELTAASFLK